MSVQNFINMKVQSEPKMSNKRLIPSANPRTVYYNAIFRKRCYRQSLADGCQQKSDGCVGGAKYDYVTTCSNHVTSRWRRRYVWRRCRRHLWRQHQQLPVNGVCFVLFINVCCRCMSTGIRRLKIITNNDWLTRYVIGPQRC